MPAVCLGFAVIEKAECWVNGKNTPSSLQLGSVGGIEIKFCSHSLQILESQGEFFGGQTRAKEVRLEGLFSQSQPVAWQCRRAHTCTSVSGAEGNGGMGTSFAEERGRREKWIPVQSLLTLSEILPGSSACGSGLVKLFF